MKPLCRMTIKDLLDQMDDQETREKEPQRVFSPDQLVCGLISVEETAYLLDVEPDALVQGLRELPIIPDQKSMPVPFFRDVNVRL